MAEHSFYSAIMGRVQYTEILCKTALNRVQGMPFKWSLNPYRGCSHGCHYCYARASHTYYGLNADEDFETRIMVKTNFPEVLRRELHRPSWKGESVALGTATDCYQPAEGRFRITRRTLETLRDARNPMTMVTKSPMVVRDLDVLGELARYVDVQVYFTITTVDQALWRSLEPGTANPFKRLEAMRSLNQVGVAAGVIMAPILPGITDSVASMEAVASASAQHGAVFFAASPLRLAPLVKEHYLGFIGATLPELLPRYQRAYPGAYAPREYLEKLDQRVRAIRARYGLDERSLRGRPASVSERADRVQSPAPAQQLQLLS